MGGKLGEDRKFAGVGIFFLAGWGGKTEKRGYFLGCGLRDFFCLRGYVEGSRVFRVAWREFRGGRDICKEA